MNHTSARININNSIENNALSIFTVMLVFTYIESSSIRKRSSTSRFNREGLPRFKAHFLYLYTSIIPFSF